MSRSMDEKCLAYKELYGIDASCLEAVRTAGEAILPRLNQLVEEFYHWLPSLPEYQQFFEDEAATEHLKALQKDYWGSFFSGLVDEPYFASRRQVGVVHATIGLSLQAYFAAMNRMLLLMTPCLEGSEDSERAQQIAAITQLMHLDTSIIVETFSAMVNRTIKEQSEAIMAMSTPVTAIWDQILMLPVVGIIDSRRAHEIMSSMLQRIKETEARIFILDISGVAVMDTAVANHLIKMTKASLLMGCECIISGISPAIAGTIVELGIDVGTVNTRSNLKDALSLAFDRTGAKISLQGRGTSS